MNYKQLTERYRYTLAALKRQGLSFTNIAKVMNRHRSTIYHEVKVTVVGLLMPLIDLLKHNVGHELGIDVQGETNI